jgi:transposase
MRTVESLVAEIGVDMDIFPSDKHLASWAGICPGNNESAGKHKNGKTRKGNRYLRRALIQSAHACITTKDSYLGAQYHRIAKRRGKKKVIIAVAHSILVVVYHILKHKIPYRDLGPDYFDRINREHLVRYHQKRLEGLGLKVTVESLEKAA